jgi:hypothetical protein
MKYEVTDQITYKTVYFTVENDNGMVYLISMIENEDGDDWNITDENHNDIEDEDMCSRLINICEAELNKKI